MSVLRNLNVLDQMRIDVPHFRLLESAARGDFDAVVGQMLGGNQALVVKGLSIAGSVGSRAEALELVVAGAIVINANASESGSFLSVPSGTANEVLNGATNGKVSGAFVSGATNYVGLDFVREEDSTTSDLVTFKDPLTGELTQELTNIGEVLTYRIVVGSTPFSAQSNVVPIAKIGVSAGGTVSSIADSRPTLFRLASGGDLPTSTWSYPWPQNRSEAADTFIGADKAISSQKDWNDAIMTRLWELGGGTNWYSNTADRNVWSINTESPFTNGDYWTFNSGTGATEWKAIRFFFTDSTAGVYYNDIAGITGSPVTVADGQCVYVDLDRTSNATLTAHVASIQTVGTGTIPGSRWILAWRNGSSLYTRNWRYPIGTLFTPATNLAQGVVRLHAAVPTPADPVVLALNLSNDKLSAILGAASGSGVGFTIAGTAGVGGIAGTGGDSSGGTGATGIAGFGGETETGTGGIGVVGTGGSDGSVNGNGGVGVKGIGATGVLTNGNGVWGVAGGAGASGVRGDATGNGYGVYGTSGALLFAAVYGANSGGGVGVNGTGGIGVSGTGSVNGVQGDGSGTGNGVYGTAPTGAGVRGVATTNRGVYGSATSGVGVRGQSTLAGGIGVQAVAQSSGNAIDATSDSGDAIVANSASGGRALTSSGGGVGVPPLDSFEYTSAKTGVVIIGATELSKISGSAVLTAMDGTLAVPYYPLAPGATAQLVTQVRLPRGATVTGIEILAKNSSGAETMARPTLRLANYTTSSGAITTSDLCSGGTFSVPGTAPAQWVSIGGVITATAISTGTTGDANSGLLILDWNPSAPISSTIRFGGWRITYTFAEVDFMV